MFTKMKRQCFSTHNGFKSMLRIWQFWHFMNHDTDNVKRLLNVSKYRPRNQKNTDWRPIIVKVG